jgi:hypothetical protein
MSPSKNPATLNAGKQKSCSQLLDRTLLQKLSAPSDYSVSDNGCTHQMALKKNSVRQGVLMGVSGWKDFRGDYRKIADEPTREHGGIQYTGEVHQVELRMHLGC